MGEHVRIRSDQNGSFYFGSLLTAAFSLTLLISSWSLAATYTYDVVIYGGNAAGVIAAYQAAKMGKRVAIVEPSKWIGGLTTGGLGYTDFGASTTIGGLSKEFYQRIGKKYGLSGPRYLIEAKVATQVLKDMIAEKRIPVFYSRRLKLSGGVAKTSGKITSITMESGDIFYGKMFIDSTYEGDLMGKAGVSYTIGRESNSQYHETYNGIQAARSVTHQLPAGIDPFKIKGNPASGLLPGVNASLSGPDGTGDKKAQAFNYRWNLTNNPNNRIIIPKPSNYNEAAYELLFRSIEKGQTSFFFLNVINKDSQGYVKIDANNKGGFSTDFVGQNYNYVEGNYTTRAQIAKNHENYQRGLLWTLQNHPRVPQKIKNIYLPYGLPKDEFTDNGYWPTSLYVREGRRMISDFVMTEHECLSKRPVSDPVAMGSYTMDSHTVQRYVDSNGYVRNEGILEIKVPKPYPISYRSIVPKEAQASNLLVPVAMAASHIAYGSIRMEPVFMMLAQSAATAAAFAIDDKVPVQKVSFPKLYSQLIADKQVLPAVTTGGRILKLEAENLPERTSGPKEEIFADPPCSNDACTKLHSSHVGDWVEYSVNLPTSGTYRIKVGIKKHSSRGRFRLYLPQADTFVGPEQDMYAPSNTYTEVDLGTYPFQSSGTKIFRFIVTGKNSSSTDLTLSFDYIQVEQ